MLFCGGARFGGSCRIGEVGFLPAVLETGGGRFVGGCVCRVMNPGVPGGGDEGGVFGFFAVDDPSAGFFGGFCIFVVSVIEGIASDEASVQEGLEDGDGACHGASVAEKIGIFNGLFTDKKGVVAQRGVRGGVGGRSSPTKTPRQRAR